MADYNQPITIMPNQTVTLPPLPPQVPIIVQARNESNTITELFVDAGSYQNLLFMEPAQTVCAVHFPSTGLPVNLRNVDPEGDSPITVTVRTW